MVERLLNGKDKGPKLPDANNPTILQQYFLTLLHRFVMASGGTVVLDTREAMQAIPITLNFAEAENGQIVAIIVAKKPPPIVIAGTDALALLGDVPARKHS